VPHSLPATIALLALLAFALPAAAHGPSVEIGAEGLAPAELRVEPGETVHFQNRDIGARRVRGAEDAFRSPELAPGSGWHLRFGFPGRFDYEVEGRPGLQGTILVGETAAAP